MTKENKKESLGFLFGYKESTSNIKNGNTTFNISFKTGTSKKFPTKFKNLKDFWAKEFFIGDSSELYINPKNFEDVFNQELQEFNNDLKLEKNSFYLESYNQKRFFFDYTITIEQFVSLNAFSMAHLSFPYQKWENDDELLKTLQNCIGKHFNYNTKSLLDIYNNYKDVIQFIYNEDIKKALGDFEFKNKKLKM